MTGIYIPIYSGKYLNFESRHPLCHKKGISLIDWTFRSSHPRFHKENLKLVVNTLLKEWISINFHFFNITTKIKTLIFSNTTQIDKIQTTNSIDNVTNNHNHYFNISYVSFLEQGLWLVIYKQKCHICQALYVSNKLTKFIRAEGQIT